MAQLPRYQTGTVSYADMPALQSVDIQERLNASKRLGSALDEMSGIANKAAKEYAVEEAVKYTIDTPVTKQQVDEALSTGKSPFEDARKAGLTFDSVVKKVYADQTGAILTAKAQEHFIEVLGRVDRGEIKDNESLSQELNSPIAGYGQVFKNLDPETYLAYDTRLKTMANGFLNKGNELIRKNTEIEFEIGLQPTIENFKKAYSIYADTNGKNPELLKGYKKMLIQAFEPLARSGTNPLANAKSLDKELENIEYSSASKNIAVEAFKRNVPVGTLLKEMTINDKAGSYTSWYKDKNEYDKKRIRELTQSEYSNLSLGSDVLAKQINSEIANVEKVLDYNQIPNIANLNKLIAQTSDPVLLAKYDIINKKMDINVISTTQSITDLEASRVNYMKTLPKALNAEQVDVMKHYDTILKNKREANNQDMVGQMHNNALFRDDSTLNFDFDVPKEPTQQKMYITDWVSKFGKRIANADAYAEINKISPQYLSQNESQQFADVFKNSNEEKQITLASMVARSAGDKAYQVFAQLAPNHPEIAQMGFIAANIGENSGDPEALKLWTQGYKLEKGTGKEKIQFAMGKEKAQKQVEVIGPSMNASAEGYNMTTRSADIIYKALAFKANSIDTFDPDLYEKALQLSAGMIIKNDEKGRSTQYGGVIDHNGMRTIIPSNAKQGGTFKNGFNDAVKKATLKDFMDAAETQDGKPNPKLAKFTVNQLRDAKLLFVSDSHAELYENDFTDTDEESRPYKLPEGNKIYINYRKLYDIVKLRNPSLGL